MIFLQQKTLRPGVRLMRAQTVSRSIEHLHSRALTQQKKDLKKERVHSKFRSLEQGIRRTLLKNFYPDSKNLSKKSIWCRPDRLIIVHTSLRFDHASRYEALPLFLLQAPTTVGTRDGSKTE